MALTRPNLENIITNVAVFSDALTVLHGGASSANVDVGFVLNRANGLVNNAAFYWSESLQSFVVALTANSGITDSNITVSTYGNLTTGNIISQSNVSGQYFVTSGTGYGNIYQVNTLTANTVSTGNIVATSNVSLTSNLWISGNITTTGNGYVQIPAGTSTQRPNPAALGMIRYNTTTSSYEGYGAGSAWSSLGGVKSVDGYAYISAEATPGAGDDVLRFYSGSTGSSTQVMWASAGNISILPTTVSTSTTTGALQVSGGAGIAGNLYIGSNAYFTSGVKGLFSPDTGSRLTFGMQDASGSIYGAYFSVFGNNYSDSTQRGSAQFITDTRNSATAGFTVGRYNGSSWTTDLQSDVNGNFIIKGTTAATSTTTGILQVAGGVGIAGNVYIGGNLSIAGNISTVNYETILYTEVANVLTTNTLSVSGNLTVSNITPTTSNLAVTGNLSVSGNVTSANQSTGNLTVTTKITTGNLTVGSLIFPIVDNGISGQVISTNGLGQLAFTTVSGGGSGTGGFTTSTITSFPTGDFGNGESYIGAGTSSLSDAFGVSLGVVYNCMDPQGTIITVNLEGTGSANANPI